MVEAQMPKEFKVDGEALAQLVNSIQSKNAEKRLDAESAATPLDEFFSCIICTSVVEEPQECVACNTLSCADCLKTWQKQRNTCPNCQGAINLNKQVNRFVMQALNSSDFNCDSCSQQFKYEKRKEHWQSCGVDFVCSFPDCDKTGVKMESQATLMDHWKIACLGISVTCTTCETQLKRSQTATHSCEQGLIMMNVKLRAQVRMLKKLLGEEKLKNQQLARPQAQQQQVCSNNHPLVLMNQSFARGLGGGRSGTGQYLRCDLCRKSYQATEGNYRCANSYCDYDVCVQCYQARARPQSAQHVAAGGLQVKDLKCDKGHSIVHYNAGQGKQRIEGNHRWMGQGLNLECSGCRRKWKTRDEGGYWTCTGTCDFDFCKKCAICERGHILKLSQGGNPYSAMYGGNGVPRCDRCRNLIPRDQWQTGFLRCTECQYDVCNSCVKRPIMP